MKKNNTFKAKAFTLLFLSGVALNSTTYADDTEVFITSSSALNPNVLFIMDNSSSMDGPDNPKGSALIDGKTRIQIMKDALRSVLSSADNNLNVGITNYGSTDTWRNDNANGIKFPIKPLNTLIKPVIEESLKDKEGQIQWRQHRQPAPAGNGISTWFNPIVDNFDALTVRQYLPEVAKAWKAYGNTPIVDALYEAALYFRGGAIRYQDVSGYGGRGHYLAAAHPSTYHYPEGVYQQSAAFPNHEFPYVPQWYADNLSSLWVERSVDENSWYLSYLKNATRDWDPLWIKCPVNTGDVNKNGRDDGKDKGEYQPLRNSGASTDQNCRIMRDDFVKHLQTEFGSAFNTVVNGINNGKKPWWVDYQTRLAIRQISDNNLEKKASSTVIKADAHSRGVLDDRKIYHFDAFPRCRVVQDVVCMTQDVEFDTSISWVTKRDKYQCVTKNSESCKSWNYESCVNPADERRVNEVVCDFDQNTSRYPSVNYTSPIEGDCQSNYIVLMSDGKPEYSQGDRLSTKSRSSNYHGNVPDMIGKECSDDPYFVAGTCGPELTHFLATEDQRLGSDGATTGDQFVNTLVIGFSDSVSSDAKATEYLKSLVTLKDKEDTPERDGFFLANNQEELAKAFSDALAEIVVSARSQATPGYSVNVKNGLEHEDSVFIPVFEKMNSQSWRGNLKKFKLVNVDGHRRIRGKTTGVDAMTELGIFKDEAWDLWSNSSTADGKSVAKGGVASLIEHPAQRKLFSNLTGDRNVNLWANDNLIKSENTILTNVLLNINDAAGEVNLAEYRQKLINFVRGWKLGDKTKGARKYMGDMLHSEPVIISYSPGDANGVGKQQYIFATTNEGYLHAFDAATGEEKFAFMPKNLLKNIYRQFVGGEESHIYGIDGNLSYVKNDGHVYLYFGLRRGGRAYYALDVTDINEPKLMWKIDGETDTDFSHLGQSWSSPYIANVKHGGKKKTAIVISGGYDTTFDYDDDSGVYQPDSVIDDKEATVGNDIYIINAKTGAKLWSMRDDMQRRDVKHAIPGGIRILDTDKNGFLDRLYFADTGGNVWRLDLHEDLSEPTKSKLVKIAELSDESTNRRKFFTEPDVARLTENGQDIFTISLGSGLRSHPLNENLTDHMFVLLERSPLAPLEETGKDKYKTIKMTDLANIAITATANTTNNTISKTLTHTGFKKGTEDTASILHAVDSDGEFKRGWFVKFPDLGEKVLSTSITFEGSLIFTSFVPKAITSGEDISVCSSPGTQGRIYAMNVLTGEASIDLTRDDNVNDNDVFSTISANEIPGKPQRIFNPLDCSSGSCKHEVDVRIGKKGSEVGTQDVSKIESIYWNAPLD